jgi:hypothetical protein
MISGRIFPQIISDIQNFILNPHFRNRQTPMKRMLLNCIVYF